MATLSACAAGPENPTYDEDIRPLLVARCVRCHTTPGQIDPASAKTGIKYLDQAAIPSLDVPYFSDIPTIMKDLPKYIRGFAPFPRMPPPPAAELEDWELKMLETWSKNPK